MYRKPVSNRQARKQHNQRASKTSAVNLRAGARCGIRM